MKNAPSSWSDIFKRSLLLRKFCLTGWLRRNCPTFFVHSHSIKCVLLEIIMFHSLMMHLLLYIIPNGSDTEFPSNSSTAKNGLILHANTNRKYGINFFHRSSCYIEKNNFENLWCMHSISLMESYKNKSLFCGW